MKLAEEGLDRLLGRMALLWAEARPLEARVTGTNLPSPERGGGREITSRLTLSVDHVPPSPRQLDRDRLARLRAVLRTHEDSDELLAVYRMGLTQTDQAAAFLLYWNVLGRLTGDEREPQEKVEDIIRRHEPSVQVIQSRRTGGRSVEETIYRHLRNRLVHGRPDAPALPGDA